jgi:hypothetical protein
MELQMINISQREQKYLWTKQNNSVLRAVVVKYQVYHCDRKSNSQNVHNCITLQSEPRSCLHDCITPHGKLRSCSQNSVYQNE